MSPLRIAVIGVGHLGKIHTKLLRSVPGAELVGVVDPVEPARNAVAAEFKTVPHADLCELLGQIDAAIIATPTKHHYAVAMDLLENGIHVFVEKPVTLNVADAKELVDLAAARDLVLQVGHVERFNPAFIAAQPHIRDPKYIEGVRTAPYTCRSFDIGVVLDLMIHDIDLVLTLVGGRVISVQALGSAVFGPNEDWAQARLLFDSGCVANLMASRVSPTAQRSLAIHTLDGFASLDLSSRKASALFHCEEVRRGKVDVSSATSEERARIKDRLFLDYLPQMDLPISDSNAILEEQKDFVSAIHHGRAPRVSGEAGLAAIDVAERILAEIAAHRWDGSAAGRIGPRHESPRTIPAPHWQFSPAAVRRKAG